MTKTKYAIIILGLALIALVLQGAIFKSIFTNFPIPNLLIIIVVFLAFFAPDHLGLYLAFILGCMYDLGTDILLGPSAAAFVVLYLILDSLSQRIFIGSFLAAIPVVFVSSIVTSLVYLLLVNGISPLEFTNLKISILEAMVTAFFAPLFFRVLYWFPGKVFST